MRAETIHVTNHALTRWKERASKTGEVNEQEIIKAVKESKVVKRSEPLPYALPRMDGSVYSVAGNILFVLESVTIDEYRLVTVRGGREQFYKASTPVPVNSREKKKKKDKEKMDNQEFPDAKSERDWLIAEKARLEHNLSGLPKKTLRYKDTLSAWVAIEDRLKKNKPRLVKERDSQPQQERLDYGQLLLTILHELKELRGMVESLTNGSRQSA